MLQMLLPIYFKSRDDDSRFEHLHTLTHIGLIAMSRKHAVNLDRSQGTTWLLLVYGSS